jgi:hypothetical protein
MKRLFFAILFLVFCSASIVSAEEDYKRLYLEQKVQSFQLEMQVLQLRFTQIQGELPQAMAELSEYIQPEATKSVEKAKTVPQPEE